MEQALFHHFLYYTYLPTTLITKPVPILLYIAIFTYMYIKRPNLPTQYVLAVNVLYHKIKSCSSTGHTPAKNSGLCIISVGTSWDINNSVQI